MRDRGTRGGSVIPYVPDATPEASLDPLLTDYIRRELEKIQDEFRGHRETLQSLTEYVWYRAARVSLEGQDTSDPIILGAVNVTSVTRVGVGLYDVLLTSLDIGQYTIGLSNSVISGEVTSNASTEPVFASYSTVTPSTIRVQTATFEVVSGNKLSVVPYELQLTDYLLFGIFSRPV